MTHFDTTFLAAYSAMLGNDARPDGQPCKLEAGKVSPETALAALRASRQGWVSTPAEARSLPGAQHVAETDILAAEFVVGPRESISIRRDGRELRAWRVVESEGTTHFRADAALLGSTAPGRWHYAVYWEREREGAVPVAQRLLQAVE